MSDLVVIAFPSEQKAEQVRQKLLIMQQEYLIELGDAVIALKQEDGRIKLNQLFSYDGGGGGLGHFLGRAGRACVPDAARRRGDRRRLGALGGALTDAGINDDFMKDAAQALQPGTAALFLLIRRMTTDKVLDALQGEGGTVMRPRSTIRTSRRSECPLRRAWRAGAAPRPRPPPTPDPARRSRLPGSG